MKLRVTILHINCVAHLPVIQIMIEISVMVSYDVSLLYFPLG